MRSLSEERRIVLWRRAIFLFRKFTGSEGPFHKAGFREFRIEQKIVGLGESKPDIISWRSDGGGGDQSVLIVELTLNAEKPKHDQLMRYLSLKPNQMNPLGITMGGTPDIVVGVPERTDADPDFCHVVLGDSLSCEWQGRLHDGLLVESLNDSVGMDLIHAPSTPFSIVPESKFMEIRRGIAPIIMQRFAPSGGSFTAESVADEALDILGEHMDSRVRNELVKSVAVQIGILRDKYLKGYIESEGDVFVLTEKGMAVHSSPQSMAKVSSQIGAWMYEKRIETYLDDFIDADDRVG